MECCLCYFGFLWICEITVPLDSLIDPNKYLCVSDLAVDNRKSPKLLRVTIKWSNCKTDPFCKCISFLSRTSTDLCPLSAIQVREWPPVDYSQICAHDKVKPEGSRHRRFKYCSHSFRIGAAMTVAAAGIKDLR